MASYASWGAKLYSGEKSYNIVGRAKIWYLLSAVVLVISIGAIALNGMQFSIDFRGGIDYAATVPADQRPAEDQVTPVREAVEATGVLNGSVPQVTASGDSRIGVQVPELSVADSAAVQQAIADTLGIDAGDIDFTSIGPRWGAQITQKGITALIVFIVLVMAVIWAYFREWRMSVAAVAALGHDVLITVGVYALVGFEVTPATIIGLLTIMGYSLYDTVVVFEKVGENTKGITATSRMTFSYATNLAVNQTMVRSINTSVSSLLPVGAILFIGAGMLGAGTLQDLALALFVGIAAGTYSSIYIAPPLLATLKERQPEMRALRARVARRQRQRPGQATPSGSSAEGESGADDEPGGAAPTPVSVGTSGSYDPVRMVSPEDSVAATGPRRQPQRKSRADRSPGGRSGRGGGSKGRGH